MGSRIKCFWLEPSQVAEVSLRRYRYSESYLKNEDGSKDYSRKDPNYYKCTNNWGCDASVVIGQKPYKEDCGLMVDPNDRADERWPKVCDLCKRPFEDTDEWQRNERQLYTRSDNGELVTIREAPVGAMWDAHWMAGRGSAERNWKKGSDGYCLTVKTPDGDWCVDGPSSNGPGWTRFGTVPEVTAMPSILMPKYHGWLRNGWLEEC